MSAGGPLAYPGGRDAPLPDWLAHGPRRTEAPRFDSVVIRGAGVGALVCAGRLARSPAFAGKVRIAMPRPEESPKLVNGCTLRSRSLDYAAAAFGVPHHELVRDLYPGGSTWAETWSQRLAVGRMRGEGGCDVMRIAKWMQGRPERPLAYGLRNGHLVGRLADRVRALGVEFDDEIASSFEACRERAAGDRPLVLNGAHLPLEGVPASAAPERFVIASQVALRSRGDVKLPEQSSTAAAQRRDGALDIGVFYPFQDPLTPDANYYVVFYRIVDPVAAGFSKPRELAALSEIRDAFADALGFDLVSSETTEAEAMIPCIPWDDVETHRPDYLDLFRTYSACTPIITGDGMARASLAGWLAAEAILVGEDPVPITNQSLHRWRRTNRMAAGGMTAKSAFAIRMMRWAPQPLLKLPGLEPDVWSRVDRADARATEPAIEPAAEQEGGAA